VLGSLAFGVGGGKHRGEWGSITTIQMSKNKRGSLQAGLGALSRHGPRTRLTARRKGFIENTIPDNEWKALRVFFPKKRGKMWQNRVLGVIECMVAKGERRDS